MSKLIVEMENPKGCSWVEKGIEKRCPMAGIDHYLQIRCRVQSGRIVHTINKSGGVDRPSWCPIIGELPETHGRLIDEAVFCENVVKYSHQSTKTIGKALDATPTIIEMTPIVTERKDDEQIH